MSRLLAAGVTLALGVLTASPVRAQQTGAAPRPAAVFELAAGSASFLDESPVTHTVFGGASRFYVTPRLGLGPELVFMRGPGSDRDLLLTGNLTFDILGPGPDRRPPRVSPFVVGGGGIFRHSERFAGTTVSHTEGGFTAGGGVRVWLTRRVYAAGEVRTGWEPHFRANAAIGVALP